MSDNPDASASSTTTRITRSTTRKRHALGDLSNARNVRSRQDARSKKQGGSSGSSSTAATQEAGKPAITDIDAAHRLDPQRCTEYVTDLVTYYRTHELKHRPSTSYIGIGEIQTDITAHMRAILIDWLVEVAEEYKLMQETLYTTVNLIDRCLSKFMMQRSKLQLLGCACMLLASKYEEIYAPAVDEFVYISDNTYTKEQVLNMETKILSNLRFHLTVVTPVTFMPRFLQAANADMQQQQLTNYLAELSLPDYDSIKFRASMIAAAALNLARQTLQKRLQLSPKEIWNADLQHYTGFKAPELEECVRHMQTLHANSKTGNLQAVHEKYSHTKTYHVAEVECIKDTSLQFETFQ